MQNKKTVNRIQFSSEWCAAQMCRCNRSSYLTQKTKFNIFIASKKWKHPWVWCCRQPSFTLCSWQHGIHGIHMDPWQTKSSQQTNGIQKVNSPCPVPAALIVSLRLRRWAPCIQWLSPSAISMGFIHVYLPNMRVCGKKTVEFLCQLNAGTSRQL